MIDKVGKDGVITVEESNTFGLEVDRSVSSAYGVFSDQPMGLDGVDRSQHAVDGKVQVTGVDTWRCDVREYKQRPE